jgi:hypothetical protein
MLMCPDAAPFRGSLCLASSLGLTSLPGNGPVRETRIVPPPSEASGEGGRARQRADGWGKPLTRARGPRGSEFCYAKPKKRIA